MQLRALLFMRRRGLPPPQSQEDQNAYKKRDRRQSKRIACFPSLIDNLSGFMAPSTANLEFEVSQAYSLKFIPRNRVVSLEPCRRASS